MTKEKMTVHKALSELKIIDDRIKKATTDVKFCNVIRHSDTKINGEPIEDWKKDASSSYDKAVDLIKRRNAIKRAVVLSNAVTKVNINGQEYTVAEAIDMKNHGLDCDALLMDKLVNDLKSAQNTAQYNNERDLPQRADNFVNAMYGGKDNKTEEANKSREEFIKANTYEVIDPLNAKEKITSLEERISSFTAEVDSALSVSNAITEIEIEY